MKDKNSNPDTEISDHWKYSDELKEPRFDNLVIGKLEKANILMGKIKKQELEQEPTGQLTND